MLRTCKKTLDVAIFTLTNDKISGAIEEAFKRGIKVRVIADDECCKMIGSDCLKLAAAGIDVKTDDAAKFHMHHKFAILDNSVVITGSFNWTVQAVKNNQENIVFYENPSLANQYTEEYNKLWTEFTTEIK
jgi:cardiolipin hydrolase